MRIRLHCDNSLPVVVHNSKYFIQCPVLMEVFVLLAVMALLMGELKCASQVHGEQFVVTVSGTILMLVSFADN